MQSINRQVAIVKVKEPYLNWINALPGIDEPSDIEELNNDCTSLLMPHFDDEDESMRYIKKVMLKSLSLSSIAGVSTKRHGPKKEIFPYFENGSK